MFAKCWLGAVAVLLVACGGKSEGSPAANGDVGGSTATGGGAPTGASRLSACDPLAAGTSAVQLDAGQVVAAGRAKDGTLYVVYGTDRLFVGSDQILTERFVIGSGGSGTETAYDFMDDDGTLVIVQVVRDGTGAHMTVAYGQQSGKGIDPGNGEPLTPVDAKLVATLGATTTQMFVVDFAASLSDGRELVVVAPVHGFDYDQFRVFFGPPTALTQRAVTNFGSSHSGQRAAVVTIDGTSAELTYLAGGPSEINPLGGPSTLTIGPIVNQLTEGPVPANASYLCLSN